MRNIVKYFYNLTLRNVPAPAARKLRFFRANRYWPNFDNPRSFNEHIFLYKKSAVPQHFAKFCDKILVKDYISHRLGDDWVNPTLWHGVSLKDVPVNLRNIPCVIKANHGSGMNIIVKDPGKFDWNAAEDITDKWLVTDWPDFYEEEWYNHINRELLIEPLLDSGSLDLPDFKFFVFSGEVRMIQVDAQRFVDHRRSFYDKNWKKLPFQLKFPKIEHDVPPPLHLEKMLEAAEIIGQDFEFVRVDFYDLPHHPIFGEITFAPESGKGKFTPRAYDFKYGKIWKDMSQEKLYR